MNRSHPSVRRRAAASMVALALASGCVDGPSAPDSGDLGSPFFVSPSFSLRAPDGQPARTAAQADALEQAFDLVNRFTFQVRRASSGQVVLDTIVSVSPGRSEYDFSFNLQAAPNESFTVTIAAYQGNRELFKADPITVKATPAAVTGGGQAPPPTNVAMRYSGPGVTATSVQISPAALVLGPGGTGRFSAAVQGSDGSTIEGVPLGWSTASGGVVSVDGGSVTALGEGVVAVVVTSPTGLEARGRAYVVGGTLAYVEDGALKVRATAGGDATTRATGGAGSPAWSPDGTRLFHTQGGSIRVAGSSAALVEGDAPSVSPDATKLAFERAGQVYFSNDDGSLPTRGPAGGAPVWDDAATLLVVGGGIRRVRADGGAGSVLVPGDAGPPARASDGRVAYVVGDALRVAGREGTLANGVGGRPSWSPGGRWLVVSGGGGLVLVPADGSAPAVSLPGLGGASQPAFQRADGVAAPASPTVTAFEPADPLPGQTVTLRGSGFDWIILANNAVVWPTRDGTETSEVTAATESTLVTVTPRTVAAGQVRVQTRSGSALLAYTPKTGAVEVVAKTPWDAAVAGVLVVVARADGTEGGRAQTDSAGAAVVPGLQPGNYTVRLTPPADFALQGDATRTVAVAAATHTLNLRLTPRIASVKVRPEKLELEVGTTLDVTLEALDGRGEVIPQLESSRWLGGLPQVGANGENFSGFLTGVAPSAEPGGSAFAVELNGQVFRLPTTVTSFISGTIMQDPPARGQSQEPSAATTDFVPGVGHTVEVRDHLTDSLRGSTQSDDRGAYKVSGLFAGSYRVTVRQVGALSPVPDRAVVVLGDERPTGKADFLMTAGEVAEIELDAGDAELDAIEETLTIGVTLKDEDGNPLGGRTPTFASSDTAVAKVNAAGVVTAVDNGSVWIRVSVPGVSDSIQIEVDQKAVRLDLGDDSEGFELLPDSVRAFVGEGGAAAVRAYDANGFLVRHKSATFASSAEEIVTIDTSGNVSMIAIGRAVVSGQMDAATDSVIVYVFSVHDGNLTVSTAGDIQSVVEGWVGRVVGDLLIESTALVTLDGLQSIFEVDGGVHLNNNASLTDMSGLESLVYVGNDLWISGNPVLQAPERVWDLYEVWGSLKLVHNGALANTTFLDSVRYVGQDFYLLDHDVLDDDHLLESTQWIGGSVLLRDNLAISSTTLFPELAAVGQDLVVEGGGVVLGFPRLEWVPGQVQIGGESYDNEIVEEVYLPKLRCIGDDLYVYGNLVLERFETPALESIEFSCASSPPAPRDLPTPRTGLEPWSFDLPAARASARRVTGAGSRLESVDAADRAALDRRRQEAAKDEAERAALRREVDAGVLAARRSTLRPQFEGTDPRAVERARRRAERDAGERERPDRPEPEKPLKTYESTPDLYISNNAALTTLRFDSLRYVEGYVQFYYNDELSALTFPSLQEIGTDLNIEYTHFRTLSFPELTHIGEDLDIDDNQHLATFEAPLLEQIGDDFYLQYNDSLAGLSLPKLHTVGYDLEIYYNTWFGGLDLPVLAYVEDDLEIYYNHGLTDVSIASESLLDVGYDLEIYYNHDLHTVSIPGLRTVEDDLEFYYNHGVQSVEFATETDLTVGYDLEVYYNNKDDGEGSSGQGSASQAPSQPWTLDIPGLVHVDDDLEIYYNHGLTGVTFASRNPATVNYEIEIYYNHHLETISAPNLTQVLQYDLDIYENEVLRSVSFPALTHIQGDLDIYDNATSEAMTGTMSVSVPNLVTVGDDLWLDYNLRLVSFSAPKLQTTGEDLTFSEHPMLTTLDLGAVISVADELEIYDNDALVSLGLPSLTRVGSQVYIYSNDALTSFDLGALVEVQFIEDAAAGSASGSSSSYGSVSIEENQALTGFQLGKLSLVGVVRLRDNPALTSLPSLGPLDPSTAVYIESMRALTNLAGLSAVNDLRELVVRYDSALTNVAALAGLTAVEVVEFRENPALTGLSMGGLTSAKRLTVANNQSIGSASFPTLTRLGDGVLRSGSGRLDVRGNAALTTLTMPELTGVDGNLFVVDNPLLANLDGIDSNKFTAPIVEVHVTGNAALTSLGGLFGIGGVDANPAVAGTFEIVGNDALPDCHIFELIDTIAERNPTGAFTLQPVHDDTCS